MYIPSIHVDGLRITYSTVMILQQMFTVCSIEAFSNLYVGVAGPGMYTAHLGHTKCVKFKRHNFFPPDQTNKKYMHVYTILIRQPAAVNGKL